MRIVTIVGMWFAGIVCILAIGTGIINLDTTDIMLGVINGIMSFTLYRQLKTMTHLQKKGSDE